MTAPDSRDSVELLPCPFCGSAAERYEYDNHDGSHWHYCVMCSNTDCPIVEMRAEEDTQEAADTVWNNRQALARGPQQAGGEDHSPEEIASVVSDLRTLAKDGWIVAGVAADMLEGPTLGSVSPQLLATKENIPSIFIKSIGDLPAVAEKLRRARLALVYARVSAGFQDAGESARDLWELEMECRRAG